LRSFLIANDRYRLQFPRAVASKGSSITLESVESALPRAVLGQLLLPGAGALVP
jgi:hypothetical protein